MRIILAAIAVVLAWTVPTISNAQISQQMARMYCGPTAEVEGSLGAEFEKRFEGQSGSPGSTKKGQIWVGPNGEYFVLQVIPEKGLSCVILGGSDLKRVQNRGDM